MADAEAYSFDQLMYGSAPSDAIYGPALSIGADQSYVTPRSEESVTSNAVQAMQPVSNDTSSWGQWGDFFKDTGKALVGYAIAKDAQQNNVQPQVVVSGQPYNRAPMGSMLPILIIGGLLLLARKA
jgi:hypothetical protein